MRISAFGEPRHILWTIYSHTMYLRKCNSHNLWLLVHARARPKRGPQETLRYFVTPDYNVSWDITHIFGSFISMSQVIFRTMNQALRVYISLLYFIFKLSKMLGK